MLYLDEFLSGYRAGLPLGKVTEFDRSYSYAYQAQHLGADAFDHAPDLAI